MAAAQYASMIVQGARNGVRKNIRMYFSDTAVAATFPSGTGAEVLSGEQDCYIVDLFTPTALATMVTGTVYVGGVATGDVLPLGACYAAAQNRPLAICPILVPRGKTVSIIQA